MLKIIICLAVLAGVYCENETRKKFDPVVKKIEDEFPGYKGRPMPKELQDMITVHKKMNDDIEECMYDFSECMAVHKSYPFCGLQIASAKTNTTQNVTKWFKNLCDFAYRLCRDGENSWISLPNSECSHLEPITEAEQSKFYDQGHNKELDSFDYSPNVNIQQDPNPNQDQIQNQDRNANQNLNPYQDQNQYHDYNANQNQNPNQDQIPNQNQNQNQNPNQYQNSNQNQNAFADQIANQDPNANKNSGQNPSIMLRGINAKINKYSQNPRSPDPIKLTNDKKAELTNLLARVTQILV